MTETKIVLIVSAIVFSMGVSLGFTSYVYKSGGLSNAVLNLKPRPDVESFPIKTARQRLEAKTDATLQAVETDNGFVAYASAKHDRCDLGRNEWKVRDGYAHRCTLQLTRFFGLDDSFRGKMIEFEKRLLNTGWKGSGQIIASYPHTATREMSMEDVLRLPEDIMDIAYRNDDMVLIVTKINRYSDQFAHNINRSLTINSTREAFFERRNVVNELNLRQTARNGHKHLISVAVYGRYYEK